MSRSAADRMFLPRRCRRSCRSGRQSCVRRISASTSRRGTPVMTDRKRQMHLGVFVLGTGNHSAGWRYEGATVSSCSLPVMQTIARTAERGKFDLFFISDGLAMDPGDHPSFVNRFEPLTLLSALSTVTTHVGLG